MGRCVWLCVCVGVCDECVWDGCVCMCVCEIDVMGECVCDVWVQVWSECVCNGWVCVMSVCVCVCEMGECVWWVYVCVCERWVCVCVRDGCVCDECMCVWERDGWVFVMGECVWWVDAGLMGVLWDGWVCVCTLVHLGGGGDTGLTLGGIYMGLLRAGFRFCRHSPFRMFNRDSSPFPLFLLLPSSLLDLPRNCPCCLPGRWHGALSLCSWAPGEADRPGRVNAPWFP